MATEYTLTDALPHFTRYLRSEDKSARTIETYTESVQRFAAFAGDQGTTIAAISRDAIRDWMLHLADSGSSAGTRFNRWNGLKAFLKWAVLDRHIDDNPMDGMRAPKLDQQIIPVLDEHQIRDLLTAVSRSRDFESARDHAIIRLLLDTGMRRAELIGIKARLDPRGRLVGGDLDLDDNTALVLGKGNRPRRVPFGNKTAQALYRYLRVRQEHPGEALDALWLGRRGALTANGLLQAIRRRGRQAGIPGLYVHHFRHTFAAQMLAHGAQEGDVMRLAGWRSRDMLARYAAATEDERARNNYRGRAPGDRF